VTNGQVAVSVLIATRNRADYLAECLQSIWEQTTGPTIEVVVVNNASTDRTAGMLADLSVREPRLRVLFEERLGRSRALNTGIAAAAGRLLLFTDDDVIVQPGWIARLHHFFAGHAEELLLAGGPIYQVPADLGDWPDWVGPNPVAEVGSLSHGAECRELLPRELLWGANMAAAASLFQRVGGWDESVGRRGDERGTYEDIEFQRRLRAIGGSIWFVPEAVIHHRLARSAVTPRTTLYRSFHGGLSLQVRELYEPSGSPVQTNMAMAAIGFGLHAVLWGCAAMLLRPLRRRAILRLGQRAAQATGQRLGLLDGFADGLVPSALPRPFAKVVRRAARGIAFGALTKAAPSSQ
jgi:GT2 family glycosyltransferase